MSDNHLWRLLRAENAVFCFQRVKNAYQKKALKNKGKGLTFRGKDDNLQLRLRFYNGRIESEPAGQKRVHTTPLQSGRTKSLKATLRQTVKPGQSLYAYQ